MQQHTSEALLNASQQFQQYERKKFGGHCINTDNSYVLREQVIAALNNSSTILLPFTIDPHGGIGPLASCFLFGTTPDPARPL
jgi:hypothetical protein